jgi:hypothetical protein
MSADEISYRLRASVREQSDRFRAFVHGNGVPLFKVPHPYLTRDYLAAEPTRRFFSAGSQQKLRSLVQMEFPDWIAAVTQEADRICEGKLRLFGHAEVDLGAVIDWSADPISGKKWPKRFWTTYDLVGNPEGGDPKVVHEINRHQHLVTLARAYAYTEDERYANAAIAQMESWIEQNPPGIGVNWTSSLEVALRALSWMWALFLLLPSRHIDDRRAERMLRSLFSHFAHIYKFPSVYSSPNTHLIGEALALYIGGTVFASIKQARKWKEFGETVLVGEAQNQVLDDGVYLELSTHYHCYALDFYLIAIALARKNGEDFPESVLARVEAMLGVLSSLARVDGSIPRFSDDDGGQAIALGSKGYQDVRSILSTGAVLFQRPDFKWRSAHFSEPTMWLLDGESYVAYDRIEQHVPERLSGLFPEGGYLTNRSGWNPGDDQFVFNFGGLGLLGGGHGHADALSFVMSSGEREILVDPGTGLYNGAPHWRDYFRSTRAHNTVVIDGEDQAVPGGTFGWETDYSTRIVRHFAFADAEYIEAEHDGYRRLPNPVIHRRRVLHVHPNCWVIADDFRGEGAHSFETFFHFPPLAAVRLDPRRSLTSVSLRLAERDYGLSFGFFSSNAVQAGIIQGSRNPVQGWYSGAYGGIQPAPVLCATVHDSVPSSSIAVLIPQTVGLDSKDLPRLYEQLIDDGTGTACMLHQAGIEDLFVMSLSQAPITVAGFTFEGEFLWVRSIEGHISEVLAINATSAAHGDHVLFENPSRVSCVNVRMNGDRLTTIYGGDERLRMSRANVSPAGRNHQVMQARPGAVI